MMIYKVTAYILMVMGRFITILEEGTTTLLRESPLEKLPLKSFSLSGWLVPLLPSKAPRGLKLLVQIVAILDILYSNFPNTIFWKTGCMIVFMYPVRSCKRLINYLRGGGVSQHLYLPKKS